MENRPSRSCKSTYKNKKRAQSCSEINFDGHKYTIDQEGDELVQMIKDKLTIASPPTSLELQLPPNITTTEIPCEQRVLQLSPSTPKSDAMGTCFTSQTPTDKTAATPDWHADQTDSPPPSVSPTAELFSLMMSGFQSTISTILQKQHAMHQDALKQQQLFQSHIHEQMMDCIKTIASTVTPPSMPVATTPVTTSPAPTTSADSTLLVSDTTVSILQQARSEVPAQVHPGPVREHQQQSTATTSATPPASNTTTTPAARKLATPKHVGQLPAAVSASKKKQQMAASNPSPQSNRTRKPYKTDAMILGSSIVRHVKGGTIRKYAGKQTKVCCFPGAGYEKLADHAEVELKYCLPTTAILHVGGNDLANSAEQQEVIENLEYLGCELKARGVKRIAISGLTPRKNLRKEILTLNKALATMCSNYGYDFIDNSNIWYRYHLAYDNIHLNYEGVEILESNYIEYLRNVGREE